MSRKFPEALPHGMRQVVVLSPHLDDAVFSLGATMSRLSRSGVPVTICTVFAGNPNSHLPPDSHQTRSGFTDSGHSSRVRRTEDAAACAVLGVEHVWLDFDDHDDCPRSERALMEAVRSQLRPDDMILAPGAPVTHPDHVLVAELARRVEASGACVGYYLEQPYATWNALARPRFLGGTSRPKTIQTPSGWRSRLVELGLHPRDHLRKLRAMGCYPSQLRVLRRLPRGRIILFELLRGGEAIAWPHGTGLDASDPCE